jgi:hypothetical protein
MNRGITYSDIVQGNQILERFDNDPYKIYNYKSALEDQELDTLLVLVSYITVYSRVELTDKKVGLFSAVAASLIQATL